MATTDNEEGKESLIFGAFASDGEERRLGFGFRANPMELLTLPPDPSGDPPALVLWGVEEEPAPA
jgi:hypothetical protein